MRDELELDLSYEDARMRLKQMDDLLDNPAWRFFLTEIVQARKLNFERMLHTMRVTSMEEVASYNNIQGRLTEITDLPRILEGIRNTLYEELKKLQDQLSDGEDNG